MPDDPNDRKQLSDRARRAFDLFASDTAYHFALRLAVLLWFTWFVLRFVLNR